MTLKVNLPDELEPTEDWCIPVYIPGNQEYHRALRSVLTHLGRWFAWERDEEKRGAIAAQRWRQADIKTFGAMVAGIRCTDEGEQEQQPGIVPIVSYGSTVTINNCQEDELSGIHINTVTDELVCYQGCGNEARYSLVRAGQPSTGEVVVIDGQEVIDPPVVIPDTYTGTQYTACGMAQTLIDRIFTIGQAAWDNRTSPWHVAQAIMAVNPGYTVNMKRVTSLYISILELAVLEGITDVDLFGGQAKKEWRCFLRNMLKGDESQDEPMSSTEYATFIAWPLGYQLFDEFPDLNTGAEVFWAAFWQNVVNVLTRDRCNQIMKEAIGVEGDCSDCDVTNSANDPLAGMDWVLTYDFGIDDRGWTANDAGCIYQAGYAWKGTDNFWNGGSIFDIQSPVMNTTTEKSGVVRYVYIELDAVIPNADHDHDGGSGLRVQTAGTNYLIAAPMNYRQLIETASGAGFETQGYWPYKSTNGTMKVWLDIDNEGNGGQRMICTKIILAGTGDAPGVQP